MDLNFWKARWNAGRIGFHEGTVNRHLAQYADHLLGPHTSGVLVPLCGKSADLTWLAAQGQRVVGVEFVQSAVEEYFDEAGVAYTHEPHHGLDRFVGGAVTMVCADFHSVTLAHTGPVNAAFDRASLIALPPEIRPRYAAHLGSLMPSGGRILLVSMSYDGGSAAVSGPPFSVPDAEVESLFGRACDLEVLSRGPAQAMPQRFDAVAVTSTVWLMTKR